MPESLYRQAMLRGVASAVPARREGEAELAAAFGERDARRLIKGTGIRERRISRGLCTSDLCHTAAQKLLQDLDWDPSSIDHLVFVTQSADHKFPASACILQQRLGLSTHCSAFDVNLGCSGYTYGLWIASKLLEPGQRALFLAGDAGVSISPTDRSAIPLFGDCGTATALERPLQGEGIEIALVGGTDGSGYANIIVPAGGGRLKSSPATLVSKPGPDGIFRTDEDLYMNGAEVFAFAIREVPPLLERCLTLKGWDKNEVDAFVFHQANAFMLSTIANKVGLPMSKVPVSIELFGNTSSASIPLTLTVCLREALQQGGTKLLLAGFGIGWSWAALALQPGPLVMPALLEI
jgi:3-oxoacyl-[acyl-carrier-protein] synthase-3